jgi:hypothetical protein
VGREGLEIRWCPMTLTDQDCHPHHPQVMCQACLAFPILMVSSLVANRG